MRFAVLLVAFVVMLSATGSTSFAQRSMSEGTGRMVLQTPGKPYSYARVTFPDGTKAERFMLKAGDCVRAIDDCRQDRERVEFAAQNTGIRPGDELWYAWSFYLPSDFPLPRPSQRYDHYPNYTFGQIHQRDQSGPELLFSLFNDGFFVVLSNPFELDDDPLNPLSAYREVPIARPQDLRGRWNRIIVNARWSRSEDGFVKVWFNGRNVWDYSGPTTNSNAELYFKYGIYRSFVSRCGGPCPDATVYYTDVRQGPTEAAVR